MSTTPPSRKQLRVKKMFTTPAAARTRAAPLLSMQESPRTGMEVLEEAEAHESSSSRMFEIRPLKEQSPTRPVGILKKQTNTKSGSLQDSINASSPSILHTSTETSEPKRTPPRLQPSSKDSRRKERPFKQHLDETTFLQDQQLRPHDSPSRTPKAPVEVGMSIQERVKILQQTAGVVDTVSTPTSSSSPLPSSVSPYNHRTQTENARSLSMPSPKEQQQQENDRSNVGSVSPKIPRSPSHNTTSRPLDASSNHVGTPPSTPPRIATFNKPEEVDETRDMDEDIVGAIGVADQSVATTTTPTTPESSNRALNSLTPPSSNTPIKTNRTGLQTPSMDHIETSSVQALQQRPQPPHELTRPFQRPIQDNDSWVVQVSDAEWDGDNQKWKYRILVQKRNAIRHNGDNESLTKAFCWRTIPDFFWLERALTDEYHGGLLIPILSIVLGRSETVAAEMPVEPALLKDWLSDIMNGCRGNGEWTVPTPSDLIDSESMSSFLYKHSLQPDHDPQRISSTPPELHSIPVFAQCSDRIMDSSPCSSPQKTIVDSLSEILSFDFCAGPMPTSEPSDVRGQRSKHRQRFTPTKVPGINCESKALGTATDFSVQDSMVESASTLSAMTLRPSASAAHSQLLAVERDLAAAYRFTALSVLERLQNLIHHEERVALGWKGFADAISSLFAYEAKVDLSEIRVKHMPYRKLTPDGLKECMDEFLQRKTNRSVPALRQLQDMVSSYVGDLSAVEPSMKSYDAAMEQVKSFPDAESIAASEDSDGRWKHGQVGPEKEPGYFPVTSTKASTAIMGRDEALYRRLLVNEGILRKTLATFFQTSTLRRIRMAWAFYKSEIRQCAELQTAAASVRKELGVVSSSSVSKLLKRHAREEKEDHSTELELFQRMVHLGHAQRSAYDSGTESSATSIGNELVEVDNDNLSEERSKAIKRDRALELARQRIGHWDAFLAMAVMEAVAVENPNVRVDETTKDLRSVRKYAMGLREKLNKCVESLDHLRESTETNSLKASRKLFVHEISVLLSGTFVEGENLPRRSSTSKSVLYHAGIDTADPLGWMSTTQAPSQGGTPTQQGDWLLKYLQTRDAPLEWLLSSLSDLLQDYYDRVEVIEGFVYMECVGIQLEKSFNLKRTKTLASFEKKADLIAAITAATKKKLPKVVKEIAQKLKKTNVSHTNVKETKEAHLESKAVKAELHALALRRLTRARELSTERVVSILDMWVKEEELNAAAEIKVLGNSIVALEDAVRSKMLLYR